MHGTCCLMLRKFQQIPSFSVLSSVRFVLSPKPHNLAVFCEESLSHLWGRIVAVAVLDMRDARKKDSMLYIL